MRHGLEGLKILIWQGQKSFAAFAADTTFFSHDARLG
jgi:hypothetical protein